MIDADALKENLKLPEESGRMGELLEMVIHGAIDDAPTIEERKTGKWNGAQNVECDQCGHLYPAFMRLEKYCPNCGARMEVGHE